ncbi:MAG: DNA cytosine methyltransferase [Parvibaculaceae bacterium]|nr:DNA cytosine methyltransferase [Parvibaculaceae bacterium]
MGNRLGKAKASDINFVDLFAGAGGLSEGFVSAGFNPIAHVESDAAACFSLRTRAAFHALASEDQSDLYIDYLNGLRTRDELYAEAELISSNQVINKEINSKNMKGIYSRIDRLLDGRELDLIVGGPPCQAYSVVGRARSDNGMEGDKRNFLFEDYAKFLKRYQPRYFVFENVVGLVSAKDKQGVSYLDKMIKKFKSAGYETEYQIVSADEYGVLQKRRRIILVGRRSGERNFFPELKKKEQTAIVDDALSDLPALRAGEGCPGPIKMGKISSQWLHDAKVRDNLYPVTWHQARPHTKQDLDIYRRAVRKWDEKGERLDYNTLPEKLKTHSNRKAFLDRFKVVAANLPASHTVVAHISKDGHYYIHPDLEQNRSLSPREAARLQSFPDNFYFESASGKPSRTAAFKQIGNAVPVVLARSIAEALREQM